MSIKISEDDSLYAIPVDGVTETDIGSFKHYFDSVIRCKKPIVLCNLKLDIIGKAIKDYSINDDSTLVHVYQASDNRNFLKNGLCSVVEVSFTDALELIVTCNDDNNNNNGDDDDCRLRRYCRVYLDKHPHIESLLDLSRITSLMGRDVKTSNVGLWISSAGCVTPLHFDLCHGWLIQVSGYKTFLLVAPTDYTCVYWSKAKSHISSINEDDRNGTTCPVDMYKWLHSSSNGDACNAERRKYPLVNECAWYIAQLSPGDCLYTPPGWYHCVLSKSTSASVLIPFDIDGRVDTILPYNVRDL